jgi:acyl carrier protein
MIDQVEKTIVDIIRETTRSPDAEMMTSTPLEELGVDSLDFVEMLFMVEERFGIDVPYNANEPSAEFAFNTVGDVVDAVSRLVKRKALAAAA